MTEESGAEAEPATGRAFLASVTEDRMMGMVFALAAEVHVLRERNRALEGVLVRRGLVAPEEFDEWAPAPEEAQAVEDDRARFVEAVLSPTIAGSKAPGGAR